MRSLVLLLLTAVLAGCPRPAPVPDDPASRLTYASMPGATDAFDAAAALYASGRFAEAVDAFRMFCAEFPLDPLAPHGELYLGRSLAAAGAHVDAERTFVALAASGEDPALVDAAVLYAGFVASLRGEHARASEILLAAIADRPAFAPDRAAIIPGDQALLRSLLAEARLQDGDVIGAISDLAVVADLGSETDLGRYAVERAESIAGLALSDAELEEIATSSSFGCAVAARAWVAALAGAGDATGASEAAARCAGDVELWGLGDDLPVIRALAANATGGSNRIGVLLSLSGPGRRAGRAALGSVLLAARSFDEASPSVTFLIRDAQGSPEVAAVEVAALAAEGVAAIVGPIENDVASAARAAAAAAGTPIITLSSMPPESPADDAWRLQADPRAEARALVARLTGDRGVSSIVLAIETGRDTAWLDRFAESVADGLEAAGGVVVDRVFVDVADVQGSAESASRTIAAAGADAVVFALSDEPASALTAWLAAQNVWSRGAESTADGRTRMVYAFNSFAWGETLVRNSLPYVDNALVALWFESSLAGGVAREFADRFSWTFGRPAGTLEAFAFDTASLVRSRLQAGATTPSSMSALLGAVDGFSGATGPVAFDDQGEPSYAPVIATVDQGQLRVLASE